MSSEGRDILERFLIALARLRRVDVGMRRLLDATTAALSALWCVGALDALVGLSAAWRLALLSVWAGGVVTAAVWIGRAAWARWDLRRLARWAERRLEVRDNRLILAVELAQTPHGGSDALCRMTVKQGVKSIEAAAPRALIDPNPNRRAARRLAAVALVSVCALVLLPRVGSAVVPRLVDPWGDHPPFTMVDFDVRVMPEAVRRGAPVRIEATLSGFRVPDRASVVWGSGESTPMAPMGDGRFTLQIERVTSARTFHIATRRGRSRSHRIDVSNAPQWVSFEARLEPPTGSPTVRAVDGGVIRAPLGTRVTLTARADVPLSHGDFTWHVERLHRGVAPPAHTTWKPSVQTPQEIQTSFVLDFDGGLALRLVGSDGGLGETVRRGAFKAVVSVEVEPSEVWPDAMQSLEQRIAALEQTVRDFAKRLTEKSNLTETDQRELNAAEASAASIDLRLRELAASAASEAQRRVTGSLDSRLSAVRQALSRATAARAAGDAESGSGRSTTEKPTALRDTPEPFAGSGVEVLVSPKDESRGAAASQQDAGIPARYRDLVEAYERWLSRQPAP